MVGFWHTRTVTRYRTAAGIKYPNHYATAEQVASSPAAYAYNCAQRAHGQFVENQPTTIASVLIAGLQYPRLTVALGLVWIVGRYLYATGYAASPKDSNGRGRLRGQFYLGAQICLTLLAIASSLGFILASQPDIHV